MKVLSDNTADKLTRLLADGGGLRQPRRVRGASTTPPAPMWQIHVTPTAGVVTVDGGDVYTPGQRYTLAPSAPGTASGDCLVVWQNGAEGGEISLLQTTAGLATPFRVLGAIVQDENTSKFHSEQFVFDPIELDIYPGEDPDAEPVELGGDDYNAADDTWEFGDTVDVPVDPEDPEGETVSKPAYPVYNPMRLFWEESTHTLWMFRRTETFNSSGVLVSVSAEVKTAVFTTVAEMP